MIVRREPEPLALCVIALAAAAVTLWLGRFQLWPAETAALAGRAMLGITGKADLSVLLAAYPPLPYLLLSAVQPIAALFGIAAPVLLTGLLAGGFVVAYAVTLRRARHGGAVLAALMVLFLAHPFTLYSAVRGPEALLLLWGVWLYGIGLFGFRATGGVNDLIVLTLSLPMLAFTNLTGAVIALSAIPFLLLAVPPQLLGRAYASVYSVLLFPLAFAFVSMCIISFMLLHDPLGFVPDEIANTGRWSDQSWWVVAATCVAGTVGTMVIIPALVLRGSTRRPLQMAAGALLGTMALAAALLAITGLATNAIEALAPAVAAAAVTSARWPLERARAPRTISLMAIGLVVALSVGVADRSAARPVIAAVAGSGDHEASSPDARFGQFLRTRRGVMIDAIAHPAVVTARGSTAGLVTAADPAFAVALLERRIAADHVATRAHRPGHSDDAITRGFSAIHERGPAGYHLAYDADGWRLWSRDPNEGMP
jgi:hypothetical protein